MISDTVPESGLAATAVPPAPVVHQSESRPTRQRGQRNRRRLIEEPGTNVKPGVAGAD